jgi:hypothetical protein
MELRSVELLYDALDPTHGPLSARDVTAAKALETDAATAAATASILIAFNMIHSPVSVVIDCDHRCARRNVACLFSN